MQTIYCLALATVFAATNSNVWALEHQIACTFDDPVFAVTDPLGREWLNAQNFAQQKVVIDLAEKQVLYPQADDVFWGAADFSLSIDEVTLGWFVSAKPKLRRPHLTLTVNRFSGVAHQIFTSREGAPVMLWSRNGRCTISARQM